MWINLFPIASKHTFVVVEELWQVEQLRDELFDVSGRVVGDQPPRGRQRVEGAVRHVEVVVYGLSNNLIILHQSVTQPNHKHTFV